MFKYLIAIAVILVILLGWVWVQGRARRFAARHPEFGPAREEGAGCGKSCLCNNKECENKTTDWSQHGASNNGSTE